MVGFSPLPDPGLDSTKVPNTPLLKVARGLSVHGWPSGHALDSEETIRFTELEDTKCMVQTYPLDRANEAFGKF
jgi:D-arabinose 1-dehydrogenase-like Zn-dependent alcohol dehydrogenase